MKTRRTLLILLILLLGTSFYRPAAADWVPIEDLLQITPTAQSTDGSITTVPIEIWNSSESAIEGALRLVYTPQLDALVPLNVQIAGEDGSNPTYYYDIDTLQEGLLESAEIAWVDMQFDAEALAEAQDNPYSLHVEVNDESLLNEIFRKKISKTPEFYSGEAGIEIMPVYVKARNTQGQSYVRDAAGELVVCCDEEFSNECSDCSVKTEADFAMVKPLIITYIQAEEDVVFNNVPCYDPNGDGAADEGLRHAHDVYAAVSLDDGLTWKRNNISRTAAKSSIAVEVCSGEPIDYPGDSESQDLVVAGHYALVTWVDKYCRSGNPWDIADSEDLYQVTGSQKTVDYLDVKGDEEPRPDLGVRPYSCLWGARGVLELNPESPEYGNLIWYKSEQLSVGRRDAIRNFTAASMPLYYDGSADPVPDTGGFAITWQEDPKGLKTGKGRGPGAGMSGACVNHKTDVWYSHIGWADFAAVDPDFVASDGGDLADPTGDSDGNAEYFCPSCPYVYDPEIGDPENGIVAGTKFSELDNSWVCPLDGAPKSEFIKDAKPHALNPLAPPVPLTDNAVCRERMPEPVYGHVHIDASDCDYYYEGGTNNQPLLWSELPDDWVCPQCGEPKTTFSGDAILIKYRHEGGPYCDRFASNPRVDADGNYVQTGTDAYLVAFYMSDGVWQDSAGNELFGVTINADGTASAADGTLAHWSGEPLDGNTGASRPNLALVNHDNQTLALVAYEETKGVGTGSDKEAAAMEQKAPIPLVQVSDGVWEAGFTNADCRSCHYQNVVPRDRFIPIDNPDACASKGGTWKNGALAYFPYTGYPLITEEPLTGLPDGVSTLNPQSEQERLVPCVKYEGGWPMYARDVERTDPNAYYDLPDHMPGWHQEALDCAKCHLPYATKDLDGDGVIDRYDLCLGSPENDETIDLVADSPTYGCAISQDPNDPDNNKDEVDRYRHGKNIYYHHFPFHQAASESVTISHGEQINLRNQYGWSAQGDIYENARRVRVVPNEVYDPQTGANITLGLLYKEGKDGQGAPADAILRLFRNGFDIDNMDPTPLNMSSSTPVWFLDPATAGSDDGTADNRAGDGSGDLVGNHQTPHAEYYYWSDDNLYDPTGYWLEEEGGAKIFSSDGYSPVLRANPFENVFSTRLEIHGSTIVSGFAHCANWSAGKKAKDHYDFYVRVSRDSGNTWTLPINVSRLDNHKESVSDCRIMLTPATIDQEYPAEPGTPADISMNGAPEVYESGDFNNPNTVFVAVGTKENLPQPNPSETELEEGEVFLDVFYSKATIEGSTGGAGGDLGLLFETMSKENPKYVYGSEPYLDPYGAETSKSENCETGTCIPHQPNPAYPEYVDEFDWLAKGDANQGDVQFLSNPQGTKLYTSWEQELPLSLDADGRKHFQGSDVWFRKIDYPDPAADPVGDVDGDGEVSWEDGNLILRSIGSTAYDPDFLWSGDYEADFRITGKDYNRWKVQFSKDLLRKKRNKWATR